MSSISICEKALWLRCYQGSSGDYDDPLAQSQGEHSPRIRSEILLFTGALSDICDHRHHATSTPRPYIQALPARLPPVCGLVRGFRVPLHEISDHSLRPVRRTYQSSCPRRELQHTTSHLGLRLPRRLLLARQHGPRLLGVLERKQTEMKDCAQRFDSWLERVDGYLITSPST